MFEFILIIKVITSFWFFCSPPDWFFSKISRCDSWSKAEGGRRKSELVYLPPSDFRLPPSKRFFLVLPI